MPTLYWALDTHFHKTPRRWHSNYSCFTEEEPEAQTLRNWPEIIQQRNIRARLKTRFGSAKTAHTFIPPPPHFHKEEVSEWKQFAWLSHIHCFLDSGGGGWQWPQHPFTWGLKTLTLCVVIGVWVIRIHSESLNFSTLKSPGVGAHKEKHCHQLFSCPDWALYSHFAKPLIICTTGP